jgi:ATP-binding cassette subfamily F protein 3
MQQAAQDKDGKRIAELSQAIHACQSAIEQEFAELEKLTDEIDSRNAFFEKQLKQLESDLNETG